MKLAGRIKKKVTKLDVFALSLYFLYAGSILFTASSLTFYILGVEHYLIVSIIPVLLLISYVWIEFTKPIKVGRVYKAWEHNGWGNSITLRNRNSCDGFLPRIPNVNDVIFWHNADGFIYSYLILRVETNNNVRDIFFSDVEEIEKVGQVQNGIPIFIDSVLQKYNYNK